MPTMDTDSGGTITVLEERDRRGPLIRRDANTVHVRLEPGDAVLLAAKLLQAHSEQGYTPGAQYLAIELPQGARGWYPADMELPEPDLPPYDRAAYPHLYEVTAHVATAEAQPQGYLLDAAQAALQGLGDHLERYTVLDVGAEEVR